MYGKIIAGYIRTASNGDIDGYKLVIFSTHDEPPKGYYYRPVWYETSENIMQSWELEERPDDSEDETEAKAEAFDILLGEKE